MSEATDLKYRAFISYSHADTSWARWLHRGLEYFHIDKDLIGRETATGTILKALRPIFRDRDDFTAGHTLTEQTLAALDAAAALIVICSPSSAKSLYVNEEIRLFKSRHQERPLIPLIVDGKPGDPELDCFPPALKFELDAAGLITTERKELLAADVREEGDGKTLALAKVIAGLLGVPSDEIFRRAERERRAAARRKRRVQALVGVLLAGIVIGLFGWWNQSYLREQIYWLTEVRPYVLTVEAERALKPKDSFQECKDCPAMAVLPAGSFAMGTSKSHDEDSNFESPQHEVVLAKQFAVGKYEVTFAEWDTCVACPGVSDSDWGRGERPVINVIWDEAEQYVTWLSRLTGKPYRLLSEAEWEYAARAGTTTLYSFGDDMAVLGEYAWYNGNSDLKTHPVGEKKPNGFGLYDMHGNVWEWVQDCWHNSYEGAPTDGSAWTTGYDCGDRVLRGGSFGERDGNLASAERYWFPTNSRATNFGFRVARTLTP
jgi:formylglycine-generating enzyme required for sulfatase activity